MDYSVYVLHDNTNGKVYVGVTSRPLKRRLNHGNGYRFHPTLWESICKNGWDSFSYEVVASGLTSDQVSAAEQAYIAKYDSTNPEKGYNREHGGIAKDKVVSDEFRKKMSEIQIGEKNHNYGKHFTPEHRKKISESNLGKKRSPETCAKNGKAKEKPVAQYSLDGAFLAVYESGRKASLVTGVQAGHISKVCKHQRSTAGGFVWAYA